MQRKPLIGRIVFGDARTVPMDGLMNRSVLDQEFPLHPLSVRHGFSLAFVIPSR